MARENCVAAAPLADAAAGLEGPHVGRGNDEQRDARDGPFDRPATRGVRGAGRSPSELGRTWQRSRYSIWRGFDTALPSAY